MISLIEANKIVYLSLGFVYRQDWYSILCPEDANVVKTQKIDIIVNFLKKHNIHGLFIWFPDLLNVSKIRHNQFRIKLYVFKSFNINCI